LDDRRFKIQSRQIQIKKGDLKSEKRFKIKKRRFQITKRRFKIKKAISNKKSDFKSQKGDSKSHKAISNKKSDLKIIIIKRLKIRKGDLKLDKKRFQINLNHNPIQSGLKSPDLKV
jgi:predicted MPP superfamily phosphohydrolase